jgi:hypothetical protein
MQSESSTPSFFAVRWPLLVGLGLLFALGLCFLLTGMGHTGGMLIYPLDDPYIHMALARHLVQDGVFGFTSDSFSNACSSPAWVMLLALGYFLLGVNDWLPLLLNVLFATLLVVRAYQIILAHSGLSKGATALSLAALVLLPPLPTLLLSGMEHTLHAWLTLEFLFILWRLPQRPNTGPLVALLALAMLLPVVRYESVFVIGMAGLWLLARRMWREAALVGLVSTVLVSAYGFYSLSQGWPFFPVSILLKNNVFTHVVSVSNQPGLLGLTLSFIAQPDKSPHVLPFWIVSLFYVILLLLRRNRTEWIGQDAWLVATALLVFVMQVLFARTGWLYRYEAWCIALSVVALAVGFGRLARLEGWRLPSNRQALALLVILSVLVAYLPLMRFLRASIDTPKAMVNMYQQPYQTARFLKANYDGRPVMLSDLGMAVYYTDIIPVDLYGLGTLELARLRLENPPDMEARFLALIDELAPDVGVFHLSMPHSLYGVTVPPVGQTADHPMRAVASWTIPDNVVANSSEICFVAMHPEQQDDLVRRLVVFVATEGLPSAVERTLFTPPDQVP